MKYLASLLLIFGFGLSGFGQTIKSLGYNTTNGQIVANTGANVLTFTNAGVAFGSGDITIQSPNILWGPDAAINLEEKYLSFDGQEKLRWQEEGVQISVPLTFSGTNTAPDTRTNLGLGWSALTNTNAATSLLGFTTNGTVVANTGTNALTFTNTNITVNNISVGGDSANGTIKSASSSSSIDFINGELSGEWKFIYTNGVNFEGPLYFVGANSNSAANSTRTNLGLGGGITTNRTFISYDGTNYTTNTVTISNGIITGWTQ